MWENLLLNVVGGILAGWTAYLWQVAKRRVTNYQFKQIFGTHKDGITLVYEEMILPPEFGSFPYIRPRPGISPQSNFSISRPIPIASVRAISYVSTAIGNFIKRSPEVRSDLDTRSILDLDFICFGGPLSNLMTETCMINSGNHLVVFEQDKVQFSLKSDGQPAVQFDPKFDYGLILKLHPAQFPDRVWISCAGIGERGTSGAAWYLANRWKELRIEAKDRPFAAIVRVEPNVEYGRDQSAELLKIII